MGNARRVLGDAAVVGESGDRLGVLEMGCTEHQPLGLEDGNTQFPECLGRNLFQQGHGAGSFSSDKGEPASRLPLVSEPAWGPPVWT